MVRNLKKFASSGRHQWCFKDKSTWSQIQHNFPDGFNLAGFHTKPDVEWLAFHQVASCDFDLRQLETASKLPSRFTNLLLLHYLNHQYMVRLLPQCSCPLVHVSERLSSSRGVRVVEDLLDIQEFSYHSLFDRFFQRAQQSSQQTHT